MRLLSETVSTEEELKDVVATATALIIHGAHLYARDLAGKTVSELRCRLLH